MNLTGSNDEKAAVLGEEITRVAGIVRNTYYANHRSIRQFYGLGMAALIPNDAGETVEDGAGSNGDARPVITGQDVRLTVPRWEDFQAWVERNEFDKDSVATLDYLNLRRFLIVTDEGLISPSGGNFAQVSVTLADEWNTQYQTTDPNALTFLDRVGVNTGTELDP